MLGQRQAALADREHLVRAPQDLGIGDLERLRRLALARAIDDDDAQRLADLGRGEADARRLVHGLQHVGHQPLDARIDAHDRLRLHLEARVGRGDDRQDGHGGALRMPRRTLRQPGSGRTRE